MDVLLTTAYFAPIRYFTTIIHSENVVLERFENYPKQTYRNRCVIYSANGPQTITVPVTKGDLLKIYTKDIRIDYSSLWQKVHFKAIESAYRNSPYYEFYIDDLQVFFQKRYELLYDLNMEILRTMCDLLSIQPSIRETDAYVDTPMDIADGRDSICPKRQSEKSTLNEYPTYRQVFEPKHGFIPNLSILDLLFNLGPDAKTYLNNKGL